MAEQPGAEGPAPSPAARRDALVHDLQRTILISSRHLRRRTADDEVSAAQFSVLAFLSRRGESTPGVVADFEHVSPPVMTRMVGRLEASGLVERAPHPRDRRQVNLRLTVAGEALVERGREQRDAWLRTSIGEVDDEEVAILHWATQILDRVLVDREP